MGRVYWGEGRGGALRWSMRNAIAAVIFDFDGVLVDTEPLHERALRETVARVGMGFDHAQYLARYVGFDDRDTFRAVARDHARVLGEEEIAALVDAKWGTMREIIEAGLVKAFPGSLELVHAAAEEVRAGRLRGVGICSGATRREIELIVTRLLGQAPGAKGSPFQTLVAADDVKVAKPNPEGYLMTAARLGVEPGACVVLEDTPRGIAAARGAGMRVVGVGHTFDVGRLREAVGDAGIVVESARGLRLGDVVG